MHNPLWPRVTLKGRVQDHSCFWMVGVCTLNMYQWRIMYLLSQQCFLFVASFSRWFDFQQSPSSGESVSPAGTPLSAQAPKYGTLIPNRIFVGGIAANVSVEVSFSSIRQNFWCTAFSTVKVYIDQVIYTWLPQRQLPVCYWPTGCAAETALGCF